MRRYFCIIGVWAVCSVALTYARPAEPLPFATSFHWLRSCVWCDFGVVFVSVWIFMFDARAAKALKDGNHLTVDGAPGLRWVAAGALRT
jgi:hypothetical protein